MLFGLKFTSRVIITHELSYVKIVRFQLKIQQIRGKRKTSKKFKAVLLRFIS